MHITFIISIFMEESSKHLDFYSVFDRINQKIVNVLIIKRLIVNWLRLRKGEAAGL